MSDENSPLAQQNQAKSAKKSSFFLVKFAFVIALLFFGYFSFRYFQIKSIEKIKAQVEAGKFDNIESDIFDLSEDSKTQDGLATDEHGLPDITLNELKEKNAEFIYRMLLKNQAQINDLKEQVKGLKGDLSKYKSQEKLAGAVFSYIDLRQKFFAGENYQDSLKSAEMAAVFDANLAVKINKLKGLLVNFSGTKNIEKDFSNLIPELIVTKNSDIGDKGFVTKVRKYFARLVIIRKIDGKDPKTLDSTLVKVEKLLQQQNYQEALNALMALDQKYHDTLVNFLNELSVAIEVTKTDQEILSYLKSLG